VLTIAHIQHAKTTVAKLKEYCAARGLPVSGRKDQLVERLVAALRDGAEEEEESEDETLRYDVKKIVDRRVVDCQVQYIVDWVGYGVEQERDGTPKWSPVRARLKPARWPSASPLTL
jgi:hypothetical protein